jgi:hypothetical protein
MYVLCRCGQLSSPVVEEAKSFFYYLFPAVFICSSVHCREDNVRTRPAHGDMEHLQYIDHHHRHPPYRIIRHRGTQSLKIEIFKALYEDLLS